MTVSDRLFISGGCAFMIISLIWKMEIHEETKKGKWKAVSVSMGLFVVQLSSGHHSDLWTKKTKLFKILNSYSNKLLPTQNTGCQQPTIFAGLKLWWAYWLDQFSRSLVWHLFLHWKHIRYFTRYHTRYHTGHYRVWIVDFWTLVAWRREIYHRSPNQRPSNTLKLENTLES